MMNRELIKQQLLNFKKEHDGISPTLRKLINLYAEVTGHTMSISTMHYNLQVICRKNNWQFNNAKVITNGEWLDHKNS